MFFYRRVIPGLAIYSYLVGDEETKRCALIDPARDILPYLQAAEEAGMTITDVIETHVHADYLSGSYEIKAHLGSEVTIHSSKMGGEKWTPKYADHLVVDGDEIKIGKLKLRAIHTPGHTPEHLAWELFEGEEKKPAALFTGDLIFAGSVGRPDLLGSQEVKTLAHQLYNTLFEKIASYPDHVEIFPGHGAGSLCGKEIGKQLSSTFGQERHSNLLLHKLPEEDWTALLMEGMPKAPPYFLRMKELNVLGPPILGDYLSRIGPLTPTTFKKQASVIIDTRPKEDFTAGHIPGAFHIPNTPLFATLVGWLIPPDTPIGLVTDHAPDIITQLIRIGYDLIAGYLEGEMKSWKVADLPIAKIKPIPANTLSLQISGNKAPQILDVRSDQEWKSGHLPNALHLPLEKLAAEGCSLSKDTPIVVVCRTGTRASVGASILQRAGYLDVANLTGGMIAWQQREVD